MLRCFVIATMVILYAAGPLSAEEDPAPSLLLQVETLTLLEQHLDEALKSAKSRDAALIEYLATIGKTQEYENYTGPDSDGPKRLTYEQMVETTQAHIQTTKMEVSGPFGPIKDMPADHLGRTLTMLEKATQKKYAAVEQKREVAHEIASYLHSIDKFDAYMKWAGVEAVKADEAQSAEMAQRQAADVQKQNQQKAQLQQSEQQQQAAQQQQLNDQFQLKQQEIQASAEVAQSQHGPAYVGGYGVGYPGWNGYADHWHDTQIRRPAGEPEHGAERAAPGGVHR